MSNRVKGTGSIRKRADGRWEGVCCIGYDSETGKLIRKSVYGKTQKEVRLLLAKLTADVDAGDYKEPEKISFSRWLDIWIDEYTINLKPSTKAAYLQHIRVHIKPYVGDVLIAQITTANIQHLYSTLLGEMKLSPKTVKNVHGVLHRALEQAKKVGYISSNPADAAITPRVEKKQVSTMESDDISLFLKQIKGTKYENAMFVAVFTGLRQGELLGLTWDCVNFEKGILLINKQHNRAKGEKEFKFSSLKNEKVRVLTVAEEVLDVLRKQKIQQEMWKKQLGENYSNPDNLVFTTETGRYVNNVMLYQRFKYIMRKLGKPEMRFHDLRHTYAVNSLRAGDDIKTVQENLGHSTAAFTLSTYAHATQGMKLESANRMSQFIKSVNIN